MSKSIFLSYARGDDEPFVARLHADLTARGFDVWWDRVSMPARGLTFLHEIRDAIDARRGMTKSECRMSKALGQRSLLVSECRLSSSLAIRNSTLATLQRNAAKVFADPGFFENVAQGRAKLGELLASKAVLAFNASSRN